jgi:hypothetical protein
MRVCALGSHKNSPAAFDLSLPLLRAAGGLIVDDRRVASVVPGAPSRDAQPSSVGLFAPSS